MCKNRIDWHDSKNNMRQFGHRDAAGGAYARRNRLDVPAGPAHGAHFRDGDVDDIGSGGLRRIAPRTERSDARGNVFYFAEHDAEWADANAAEFPDAGGEVGGCARGAIDDDGLRVRLGGGSSASKAAASPPTPKLICDAARMW